MNKLLVILGPTASGKTALAVKLARLFNGEIISADSRQVYRGLDVGTGKDLKEYMIKTNKGIEKIPYHLIDVVSPKKRYTLADWQKEAKEKILEIQKRGKLPILCGGTGLYISSIVNDYSLPKIKKTKKELALIKKRLGKLSLKQLLAQLRKIDPKTYRVIDKNNPRRVYRALEIYYQTGLAKSEQLNDNHDKNNSLDILEIGLKPEPDELKKKIDKRLISWLDKEDLLGEVKRLRKNGLSWKRLDEFGLEYRWVARYLQKKVDYLTMYDKTRYDLYHYAKRQMTWFKRDKKIVWLEDYKKAKDLANDWLR